MNIMFVNYNFKGLPYHFSHKNAAKISPQTPSINCRLEPRPYPPVTLSPVEGCL